jgi:outer membrane murein-binding lipoprotein Lpp
MVKYLILIAAVFLMVGCPSTEKYKAEQQAAIAKQEAARADQLAQQARMVESDNNAAMMRTLADAAKPNYWPILVVVVVGFAGVLLVVRWHMVTVSHVAAGQAVQAQQLRLLPSEVSFAQLRAMARREGKELEVIDGSFFLVDSQGEKQRIKALIG